MKLEIKNVTKTYGNIKALNNFSMEFQAGIYGILGSNGAGKSTLINLITDNVSRDSGVESGKIQYNEEDILKLGRKFRRIVGYMPQQQGFYDEFSAKAFLQYMASIKEIPRKIANKQIDELLEIVNLTKFAHNKVGGFSGGMKQRVLLAQALLGDPKIIILDEPTAGLDPKERITIRNYIAELSKDKIILFATHVVSDIECIADQVLFVKQGEIVAKGTPGELIRSMHDKVAEISCTLDQITELQAHYKVGNVKQRSDGLVLRIVGDNLPTEFEKVNHDINLEDVYLYYFE
ncbi:ABC transporter ATP-binding protein [[Clostridium] fimetarium]|uniref:ABC-type multidrug transport system, ATPase component n=1 Tax=[Clostridium] fimetarium TaxID=99656 RepID=A0A1I0RVR3_9FIRM|nr:ATP-binding cassette domain-containing protein [[Clostridium] fimetarium]SEW44898.1 ABC-type multidrug transport system, ATPase component [[Clostridium] fimetarium]